MRSGDRADPTAARGGARFDALSPGGASFVFHEPRGEVIAAGLDEVVPALERVQHAVEAGLHAAGFVAYEAAPALEPALSTHPPRPDLPLVWFGLYGRRDPVAPLAGIASHGGGPEIVGDWAPSVRAPEYARRVEVVRERIAAGDTYQVNLTFALRAPFNGDAGGLYEQLCRSQRAGYCAWLRGPFGSILSASPELFFRWTGRDLEMRPMKGTRPRGRWTAEDDALAHDLLTSAKERAENLMIVDLLRNDAGRVAEFGTVEVSDLFRVERYPTVLQLTSTVRARTREGTTLLDLLRAIFPSGSVTGAPKVSTMRIIRDLEDRPRGVYTGAIGFVSPGEAVFNVPIRTLLLGSGGLEMGVGSGITYDSLAEAEHAECMQKAAFVRQRADPGDLLETMRFDRATGFHRLDAHLRRLAGSARYFGYSMDPERIREALRAAVAGAGGVAGGIEAEGGPAHGEAGTAAPTTPRPFRVRLIVRPDGEPTVEAEPLWPRSRIRARLAAEPVRSSDTQLYHKTTAREPYERRLAAHPGYDEVLLVNERGEPTEFTTGNLLVVLGGRAFTPPVACGLLPGVEREALLASGEAVERVLNVADLARAEAVYLINSVRDRLPVDLET